jgi:aminoglycoside 6-adenylyltransferase
LQEGLNGYTRLTLFKDGFKLDFGFQDIRLAKYANDMPLYRVYVDKDNVIPAPEVIDEQKFYVKAPTQEEFDQVLADFFFDTSYVVKSIYREELFFQKYMFGILHKKIYDLVRWYIGTKHDFKVNTGSMGRYFKRYLTTEEWQLLERTYSGPCVESNVRALLTMFELVRYLGKQVSEYLSLKYPDKLNDDMLEYCSTLIDKYISSSQDHQGSCKN